MKPEPREPETRRFNLGHAMRSWQVRHPSKLKRIAVLKKIRADASAKRQDWTAQNVKKMLRELRA